MKNKFATSILMLLIIFFGYFPFITELLYGKYNFLIFIPLTTATAIFFYILTLVLSSVIIFILQKNLLQKFWKRSLMLLVFLSWLFIIAVSETGDMFFPDREWITWIINAIFTSIVLLLIIGKYVFPKLARLKRW